MTTWNTTLKPTTTVEYLVTEVLDYLMTEDNDYLITNQSNVWTKSLKPTTVWTNINK